MQRDNDIAILGGGCAGLSLAMRLAELGEHGPQAVVLESRARYLADRTWCFWDDGTARLSHLVRHRWSSLTVGAGARRVTVDCRATPYQMIPADVFYAAATGAIAKTTRIELAMKETIVSEPRKEGLRWRIETSAGLRSAKWIIDTRPGPPPERGAAILWQSFSGLEIECDADRFDPGSATLMEFSFGRAAEIAFLYLLPFSSRCALIEATVFAPEPLGPSELAASLESLVHRQVKGAGYAVLRSEHGVLPMGQAAPAPNPDVTYVRAGAAAGGVRAASGFAFQRIQRWAEDCAAALAAGRPPLAHPSDPWLLRSMDRLFLRVLRAEPEGAPTLFLKLFSMKNPGRVVRFMSDRATLTDCVAIILALPARPFLREIVHGFMANSLAPTRSRVG